ncbi:hypothetical protein B566_EDAN004052 [Ephemera danica]|nr:hypothetical protein B566_EDAN004052 [Ephemera danica]
MSKISKMADHQGNSSNNHLSQVDRGRLKLSFGFQPNSSPSHFPSLPLAGACTGGGAVPPPIMIMLSTTIKQLYKNCPSVCEQF